MSLLTRRSVRLLPRTTFLTTDRPSSSEVIMNDETTTPQTQNGGAPGETTTLASISRTNPVAVHGPKPTASYYSNSLDGGRVRKPRWSRQQKREMNAGKSESNETSVAPIASRPIKHAQRKRPAAKKKQTSTAAPPLSPLQRQLVCADKAFRTGSVRVTTMIRPKDSEQGTEQTDVHNNSAPLAVTTTCLPLHHPSNDGEPSLFVDPTIYVQPLLVLDLNGILCHRIRKHARVPNAPYRPAAATIANTPVVPRMHLVSFLTFLDAHFTLAVWTSAKASTAKRLISLLMPPPISERLLFVWSQNRCDKLNPEDHPADIVFIKSLDKVWRDFPLWDASNTLLMDDSPEKCPLAFQGNAIHPPPLSGQAAYQQPYTPTESYGGLYGYGSGLTRPPHNYLTTQLTLPDEENETRQMRFFQSMVQHYLTNVEATDGNRRGDADFLMSFLREHAVDHMGWRGPAADDIVMAERVAAKT